MTYVLFADDSAEMRAMVRDLLVASGHEVALAPDGERAMQLLREREPDLLILDINMPGRSGVEVCRAVKQNPFTARIPVLILTGHSGVNRTVEGLEAGADAYLVKPFDTREFLARVTALLRLVRRESDRNPTSGLPGGRSIEDSIVARLARRDGVPFSVCYLDLDAFKAFADTFGFALADAVIREMGDEIRRVVESVGGKNDFAGHVGGDDFLVVTDADRADDVTRGVRDGVSKVFARVLATSGAADVLEQGAFTAVDRDGTERQFPIACLSAAVIDVEPAGWVSLAQLGARAAELKRRAKVAGPGSIVREQV